jgi:two-component system osmolarity sensor histidine kinase EnvZ
MEQIEDLPLKNRHLPALSVRFASPRLFWRTFLLIVALAVASLVAWWPAVRVFEREPRAHQLAQQIVSMVHATRIALVYSDPERRRAMLSDMFEDESLRVLPLEPTDRVEPIEDSKLLQLVVSEVQQRLGANTRLASSVNGTAGFWVSFSIDEDGYWVFIDRDLLRRDIGHAWIAQAVVATAFSLLVAIAIARLVNRPLAELSSAAQELGAGRVPAPLPERGPVEIRMVNQSFNRMVSDLEKLNQDRAILLAGVSHDLRTPLTRLRLELEMNELPESSREAMIGDLEQMDSIVTQFLDYARPAPHRDVENVDLSTLVREALVRNRLLHTMPESPASEVDAAHVQAVRLHEQVQPGIVVRGYRTELARTLDNLIANAHRYGRSPGKALELEVSLQRDDGDALLAVADQGPGIHKDEIARLVRPFERGDTSRSGAVGAGLGLAIVDRVVRMHGARLALRHNTPTGLRVEIRIPLASSVRPAEADIA